MKTYNLDNDTLLIPEIVADKVCLAAGITDLGIIRHLCARARWHFHQAGSREKLYRKKLRSAKGREWLACFMKHWLDSIVANPSNLELDYEL